MRPIDADAFFEDFPEVRDYEWVSQEYEVDAVPVVRCGECNRPQLRKIGMAYCPMIVGGWISNDFFCKYGERRADDE